MLRLSLLALVVFLSSLPADAQRRRDHRFAEKGDFALTFGFDGFATQPFMGGVGGRVWVSPRTVLNTSLGFGVGLADGDASQWATRFSVGAERHFGRSRRVSPFVAFGTSVGYRENTQDIVVYPDVPPCEPGGPCPEPFPFEYAISNSQTSVSAAGFLGAEVRIVEGLTLAAAHSLGITYTRDSVDYPIFEFPDGCGDRLCTSLGGSDSREALRIGTGTSQLTLSFYF